MKLLQVKKLVLAILVIASTLNLFGQNPPSIKYVSVNPLNDKITIAWYHNQLNVDSFQLSYIISYSPLWSKIVKNFKITDSVYTFSVSEIPWVGTSTVQSSIGLVLGSFAGGSVTTQNFLNQKTIYVTSKFQDCPVKNILTWTKYKANNVTVNKYNIYKSVAGVSTFLGTVPATDSTYEHIITSGAGSYSYYIEGEITDVKGNPQKTTSNMTSSKVVLPKYPDLMYGNYTQVVNNNNIKLNFTIDLNSDIKHYKVFVSDKINGKYTAIPWTDVPVVANAELVFNDTTTGCALKQNYYKLYALNVCNDTVKSSNIVSNILLSIQKSDNANVLDWNNFYLCPTGVKKYDLFRSIDKEEAYSIFTDLDVENTEYQYTDNLELVTGPGNEQCYYVEALPTIYYSYKTKSNCISNMVCLRQEDRSFIPDAFNPVSKVVVNRTFRPIITFVDKSTYQFTVFNRLSERIFTTNDPNVAWDGKFKNEYVAEGTYIYDLKYKNAEGKIVEKRNTFFVVYNDK